ncbi:hypothetical protein [Acidobacterium capsulatum]|uniref:Lipoprotein n=1 Tax=Acidobacterium capsulatum (strain ATCC 51196 / DSM 11244 / BCRC 80197 / JCM 7670 / NBRC 15755 / NCIMB 13165 / 161) TaxID=240015 RepID=C1F139_ACIC5|nr:hypothetical protein [Acidobacterium capsulatum]ACO31301.1 hypothetical protein ACP_0540 [Acidobacterium capsulatum ATCC 51196]
MERKSISPVLSSVLLRCLATLALLCALAGSSQARAQVAESAVGGNQKISAGVLGSAFENNYGNRRIVGTGENTHVTRSINVSMTVTK